MRTSDVARNGIGVCLVLMLFGVTAPLLAQQATGASSALVPPLVSFSGVLNDINNKPLTGVVGVTFALYKDQQGSGAPLWLETQNVYPDKTGHYTVSLGATSSTGLPADVFESGEARWLGVQAQGQSEQPRILLLSVPYALKAADAQTVGGLPPSAFVLAPLSKPTSANVASPKAAQSAATGTTPVTTAGGTINQLAKFDAAADITTSQIFDNGTNVGIGLTTPAAKLDVKGTINTSTGFSFSGQKIAFGTYKNATAFLGFGGGATTTGMYDTATGYWALHSNTTGSYNVANGNSALASNVGGSNNTAIGSSALGTNNSGVHNTATGYQSLVDNTTGFSNTATGSETLFNNNGNYNTAAGVAALFSNTTGSNNTAIGYGSGPDSASTGLTNSTAIGANAVVSESNALVLGCISGVNSCLGAVNVGVGTATPAYTLDVRGTGNFTGIVNFASGQTFSGAATLGANTFTGNQTVNGNISATGLLSGTAFNIGSNLFASGSYANANAFLGFAGNPATVAYSNTAVGTSALQSDIGDSAGDGWYNTAVGTGALYTNNNTSGAGVWASWNTAVGAGALYSNTGYQNTAAGYQSLYSNTNGTDSTALGNWALYSNTTGSENTASGVMALYSNTTGSQNAAFGDHVLRYSSTASYNTASGSQALYSTTIGALNTANGYDALTNNTTGSYNTALGAQALAANTAGTYNTALGYGADMSSNSLTNATAIGAMATVAESNAIVLGGTVNYAVKVGIGTSTPTNVFTIAQGSGHAIADGWDTYSSRRWKTNIHTLHGALGKIEQMRGVSYDLKDSGKHEIGVIAEEVGAVVPEVVSWENNGTDARGVDYSRLTALLIEATKEQQSLIQKQQKQIRFQQAQIERLGAQVKTIQTALKTDGRAISEARTSEVRTVKAHVPVAHQ